MYVLGYTLDITADVNKIKYVVINYFQEDISFIREILDFQELSVHK